MSVPDRATTVCPRPPPPVADAVAVAVAVAGGVVAGSARPTGPRRRQPAVTAACVVGARAGCAVAAVPGANSGF